MKGERCEGGAKEIIFRFLPPTLSVLLSGPFRASLASFPGLETWERD